jgi:hypothetical protein
MTTQIIAKEEIRAHILKVLSGYCFSDRNASSPEITILSPWISDVQLELDESIFNLDKLWFGLDYGIESINLAYALLLLKTEVGARIDIVTLPPTRENYGEGANYRRLLLDFLDEIGCDIYLNSELHSKLILSNDSALLGSFNLSNSALYNREEIGVSIDDIGNLKILENYVHDLIKSSGPYGISPKIQLTYGPRFYTNKLTRGKLFDIIIHKFYQHQYRGRYYEFTREIMELESTYSKYFIQEITSDLEGFYTKAILSFLDYCTKYDEDDRLHEFLNLINYHAKFNPEYIIRCIKKQYARTEFPKIRLKLKRMPPVQGEVTPQWAYNHEYST